MLSEPIAITGNGAAENFARISVTGQTALYTVTSRAPGSTNELKIAHEKVGSGISQRQRSVVRLAENIVLSDGATPGQIIVQLTVDNPVSQANDTAALEAIAKIAHWLDGTGDQALLDGQI